MPRSIELFAGGGGMALGLHLAGFDHLRLVEWDSKACDTLRLNASRADPQTGRPPWSADAVVSGDVREFVERLGTEDLEDVDLVAGGPPCQPFSLGGLHAGQHDSRNMFPAALDVVRSCRPKTVIFENVPGLLRPSFRPYFDYVRDQLQAPSIVPASDEPWHDHWDRVRRNAATSELRYRVARQVLVASDLGVGQVRKRVFLIGIRDDQGVDWGELSGDHSEDALIYDKYVSGSYWAEHEEDRSIRAFARRPPEPPPALTARVERLHRDERPSEKRWRTVRDVLREPEPLPEPVDGEQRGKWPNHVGVPGARSYPGHTGSDIDSPAKTIKAGVHGVCGGEAMIRFRDGSLRYMTSREAARVQGFPDWYEFPGARSHAMRQIGNAVAVRVAQAVGERLRTLTGI